MNNILKNITNKDIINGSFVVPESVTEIGEGAFYGCTNLKNITLPEGVTKIGIDAFYGCSSLTNITIPESVTKIWDYAFCRCSSLKKVSLPKKVKLGDSVFHGCHPDIELVYRD